MVLRDLRARATRSSTRLGRTICKHFDFSARRCGRDVSTVSLHRLGTEDHLDIVLCHDIEFVPMQQMSTSTGSRRSPVQDRKSPLHRESPATP
jgi:hypothetical protein